MCVGQAEFVEVVDVGDAKVQRSEEDDLIPREAGNYMQWYYEGSPD